MITTEQTLRESEARFRSVLENSRDVIYRMNVQTGRYEYISPSSKTIVGFSPEYLMSLDYETSLAMIHPDDLPVMQTKMERLKDASQGEIEYRQRTKSGDYRWISNHISIIKDGAGRQLYRDGNIRDITERKQAEKALQESEERLRLAMNAAHMTAWEYNPATSRVTFSENAENVLGLPRRHENSNQGYSLIHPNDVEHHRALVTEAISTGGGYVSVYRHVHGEQMIWLEEHGRAVVDRSGKTVRLVGVVQNITDRKQAEEELRRKQAEVRALLENTPAGLVLFEGTPPYKVLAHNRYYQELFAEPFRSKGMVGLNVYEYAPAVEAEGVVAVFDEVVRTKQPKSFLDFPYKSNPPEQSWFNWHISPLILDEQVVALVSMSLNVTDRHKAEEGLQKAIEELAASNEELRATTEELQREIENRRHAEEELLKAHDVLEQKVLERTAEFVKAKEIAEEALEVKAAFMANMSHELRTPMNSVIGFTSLLLLDEQLTFEQKDYLEIIRNSGESLLALINEILDFSKLEQDKTDLELQSFNLRTISGRISGPCVYQGSRKGSGTDLHLWQRRA